MLRKMMIALSAALFAALAAEPLAAQKICPGGKLAGANQPCRPQTATAKKEGKGARSVPSGRITGLATDPSDPAAAKCKNKACTGELTPAQKKTKDNQHLNVESWSWGSK